MMKTALALLSVSALVTVVGCSSGSSDPFGPDPDYGTVQGHFDHPDGTFNNDNASSVFGSMSGSGNANITGTLGGSSTSSSSSTGSAIHLLDASTTNSCAALQQGAKSGSCACPSGGDFQYELDQSGSGENQDITMKIAATGCSSNGVTVDGKEFVHMTTSSGSLSMLAVVDMTVQALGKTTTLDIEESLTNNSLQVAVKVNDGYVAISASSSGTDSGTVTVRDRQGTWTCTETNGAGSCTGPSGSVSFTKS